MSRKLPFCFFWKDIWTLSHWYLFSALFSAEHSPFLPQSLRKFTSGPYHYRSRNWTLRNSTMFWLGNGMIHIWIVIACHRGSCLSDFFALIKVEMIEIVISITTCSSNTPHTKATSTNTVIVVAEGLLSVFWSSIAISKTIRALPLTWHYETWWLLDAMLSLTHVCQGQCMTYHASLATLLDFMLVKVFSCSLVLSGATWPQGR